jgi:hypothetical protein
MNNERYLINKYIEIEYTEWNIKYIVNCIIIKLDTQFLKLASVKWYFYK